MPEQKEPESALGLGAGPAWPIWSRACISAIAFAWPSVGAGVLVALWRLVGVPPVSSRPRLMASILVAGVLVASPAPWQPGGMASCDMLIVLLRWRRQLRQFK